MRPACTITVSTDHPCEERVTADFLALKKPIEAQRR